MCHGLFHAAPGALRAGSYLQGGELYTAPALTFHVDVPRHGLRPAGLVSLGGGLGLFHRYIAASMNTPRPATFSASPLPLSRGGCFPLRQPHHPVHVLRNISASPPIPWWRTRRTPRPSSPQEVPCLPAGRSRVHPLCHGGNLYLTGTLDFASGGLFGPGHDRHARVIFACFMIGFSAEAALMPLHRIAASAMIAPTPRSARCCMRLPWSRPGSSAYCGCSILYVFGRKARLLGLWEILHLVHFLHGDSAQSNSPHQTT